MNALADYARDRARGAPTVEQQQGRRRVDEVLARTSFLFPEKEAWFTRAKALIARLPGA